MLADAVIIFVILLGVAGILAASQRYAPFTIAMVVYGLVLSVATLLSLADSVTIADWSTPYIGQSDGTRYFEEASLFAQVGLESFQSLVNTNYTGFQVFLGFLFRIFGPSLLVSLIANQILLLLTLACLYRATLIATNSQRAAMLSALALMLTPQAIFYSLFLLKEPALCLAFALLLLAVVKAAMDKNVGLGALVCFALALLIIFTMRASLIAFLFVLMGVVGSLLIKKRGYVIAVFLAVMVVGLPLAQQFSARELNIEFFLETIGSNRIIEDRFAESDLDLGGIAGRVVNLYMNFPFAARVVLFPLPTVIQIFMPFDFWSSKFLDDHVAYFFINNLNPVWFLFIAAWIGFAIFKLPRAEQPLLGRLLLAGVFYFIATAIIYFGLIPRYVIPALIFMYPSVGYWWSRSREEREIRHDAKRFFGHYYSFLALAVFGYFGFQLSRFI